MIVSGARLGISGPPSGVRPASTRPTDIARFDEMPESVVRIDDDDIELHNMDTIDLTGLYNEELDRRRPTRSAPRELTDRAPDNLIVGPKGPILMFRGCGAVR